MQLFTDPLHDEFAAWSTGYVTSGGADLGELEAIAASFGSATDDGAFFDLWAAAGDRHVAAAATATDAGHRETAHGHELRAMSSYGVAIRPLYGAPVDPRLADGFERLMGAFERAMGLLQPPAEPLDIRFDGCQLPAYFLRGAGAAPGERRPLVITTNGYDATIADMYLAIGQAAAQRGYHCVMFDGPGQGAPLVRDGVTMIADWERVVSTVVDAVITRPDVDPDRIALHGWSLGGHLAARAASGEHRLAACVLDPPLWGVLDGMVGLVSHLGFAGAVANLPELSEHDAAQITALIDGDRSLRWKIIQRGFWVNGATDLRSYLAAVAPFTMEGRAADVQCPVLGTAAEGDPLALGAQQFLDRLPCPTTLLTFTAAEGAGGHCEMQNRWLLNQRVLDWLDDTMGR